VKQVAFQPRRADPDGPACRVA